MYESTSTFLQSELAYRGSRLKSGLTGSRRRSLGIAQRIHRAMRAADGNR